MFTKENKLVFLLFIFLQGTPVVFAAQENDEHNEDMEVDLPIYVRQVQEKNKNIVSMINQVSVLQNSFNAARETSAQLQDVFKQNNEQERKRKRDSEDDDHQRKKQKCDELCADFMSCLKGCKDQLKACLDAGNSAIAALEDATNSLKASQAEYYKHIEKARVILDTAVFTKATLLEEPREEISAEDGDKNKEEDGDIDGDNSDNSSSSSPGKEVFTIKLDKKLTKREMIEFFITQLNNAHEQSYSEVHLESSKLVDIKLKEQGLPLKNFSALSFKNFEKERLKELFTEIVGTTKQLSVEGEQIVASVLKGSKCKWEALEDLTLTETATMNSDEIVDYINNFKVQKGPKFCAEYLKSITFNFIDMEPRNGNIKNIKDAAEKIAEDKNWPSLIISINGEIVYEYKKPAK